MRLADFIEGNCEPILKEWEEFASTRGPAGHAMDRAELRDHALAMLSAIVADLRTPQSNEEQSDKSKGLADSNSDTPETAAQVHGAGRAEDGFTVEEMVSEYRALRASVLRLWTTENGQLEREDIEDLMRFNETIDQALAESIERYAEDVAHSKELFLAILGHDLRTPLGVVIMGTQFMLDTGELHEPHLTLTTRIAHSARRMNRMVGDLLDLTRSRLGTGIPIVPAPMDLAKEASHAVDEIRGAHPGAQVQLNTSGDLTGTWDCPRISQVLANLLGNAVHHGTNGTMISLTARGEATEVVLQVYNRGPRIPDEARSTLFDPFKRVAEASQVGAQGSLGLGLYIADRIVTAHGGKITVDSTDTGTFFTVRLPRQLPKKHEQPVVASA